MTAADIVHVRFVQLPPYEAKNARVMGWIAIICMSVCIALLLYLDRHTFVTCYKHLRRTLKIIRNATSWDIL